MNPPETDTVKIAVISTTVTTIQRDLTELKGTLKDFTDTFATREQLAVIAKETEVRITKLESGRLLERWILFTLSAVLGSVLTFLVQNYLSK